MSKECFLENDYYVNIKFSDIDIMKIMWHGHYVRYMEEARFAMLEKVNYSYQIMLDSGIIWPIAKIDIKYIRPARMGDRVRVNTKLVEFENRVVIDYIFYDKEEKVLCKATTCQIAVDAATNETLFVTPKSFLDIVLKDRK